MPAYHPRLPWIVYEPARSGGFVVTDTRSGARAFARDERALAEFAADHSAAPGYRGLGDAVRGVTSRMGIQGCTPCARRQAQLNGFFPKLFRR